MERPFARRPRVWIAATLLVALLPFSTLGCFGSFRLTGKIYRFNRDISSDKWIRWIGFLVLTVIPFYPVGVLIDAVFANSVEFWSGSNPFAAAPGTVRTAFGPHGETVTARWQDDGSIQLEIVHVAGEARTLVLVQEAGGVVAYDPSGRRVASLVELGGTPRVIRN